MSDVTRPFGDVPEDPAAARDELPELVGELTHLVLGLFRERGLGIGRQLASAGADPLEVLVVFATALRALADGLEAPVTEAFED